MIAPNFIDLLEFSVNNPQEEEEVGLNTPTESENFDQIVTDFKGEDTVTAFNVLENDESDSETAVTLTEHMGEMLDNQVSEEALVSIYSIIKRTSGRDPSVELGMESYGRTPTLREEMTHIASCESLGKMIVNAWNTFWRKFGEIISKFLKTIGIIGSKIFDKLKSLWKKTKDTSEECVKSSAILLEYKPQSPKPAEEVSETLRELGMTKAAEEVSALPNLALEELKSKLAELEANEVKDELVFNTAFIKMGFDTVNPTAGDFMAFINRNVMSIRDLLTKEFEYSVVELLEEILGKYSEAINSVNNLKPGNKSNRFDRIEQNLKDIDAKIIKTYKLKGVDGEEIVKVGTIRDSNSKRQIADFLKFRAIFKDSKFVDGDYIFEGRDYYADRNSDDKFEDVTVSGLEFKSSIVPTNFEEINSTFMNYRDIMVDYGVLSDKMVREGSKTLVGLEILKGSQGGGSDRLNRIYQFIENCQSDRRLIDKIKIEGNKSNEMAKNPFFLKATDNNMILGAYSKRDIESVDSELISELSRSRPGNFFNWLEDKGLMTFTDGEESNDGQEDLYSRVVRLRIPLGRMATSAFHNFYRPTIGFYSQMIHEADRFFEACDKQMKLVIEHNAKISALKDVISKSGG